MSSNRLPGGRLILVPRRYETFGSSSSSAHLLQSPKEYKKKCISV